MMAAISATVGVSKIARIGSRTPVASRICAISWTATSELPPRSKKSLSGAHGRHAEHRRPDPGDHRLGRVRVRVRRPAVPPRASAGPGRRMPPARRGPPVRRPSPASAARSPRARRGPPPRLRRNASTPSAGREPPLVGVRRCGRRATRRGRTESMRRNRKSVTDTSSVPSSSTTVKLSLRMSAPPVGLAERAVHPHAGRQPVRAPAAARSPWAARRRRSRRRRTSPGPARRGRSPSPAGRRAGPREPPAA